MIHKILISQTRPVSEHNAFTEMERQYGVTFDFHPLIRIEGLSAVEFRAQHINPLDYTGVVLASKIAAEQYFHMLDELKLKLPEDMHFYCISESVAMFLTKYIQYRKRKVFFGESNRFESILPTLSRHKSERLLIVQSEVHSDDVENLLTGKCAEVQSAVFYRTVIDEWPQSEPFDYDLIALMTPAGVQSVLKNFPDFQQGDRVFACFGKGTQDAAEAAGWTVQIKAPRPGCPGLAGAIDKYLEENIEER